MKKLFNFTNMSKFPLQGLVNVQQLRTFLEEKRLDGVELILWDDSIDNTAFKREIVGVHLKYWPSWLPIYEGRRQKNSGISYEDWLEQIKSNVRAALSLEPEYLVWHVADCTLQECFSFQFNRSNMEVLQATAELVPEIFAEVPPQVKILFENLWWPGLTLLDNRETEWFFDELALPNAGLVLDTGHLLNTDYTATTEQECIQVLLQRVRAMGELRQLIKGVHLNLSISAPYRRGCWGQVKNVYTQDDICCHIAKIDQHRGFTDASLTELLDLIQPEYVNNELLFNTKEELSVLLDKQLLAAGI